MSRPKMTEEQRIASFWRKVRYAKMTDCWLWVGAKNGPGYGKFWDGEAIEMAHRYSYKLAYGAIPKGLFVLHQCDIPACVNPDHLFVGTQRDNCLDAYAKGRLKICEFNGTDIGTMRKLDSETVEKVKILYTSGGYTQVEIANMLKVSQAVISKIVRGVY